MTAVTVAIVGVRKHDMGDADSNLGVGSLGGGPGAAAEPDFVFQGSNSISRKIGTTLAGFEINTSGSIFSPFRSGDMSSTGNQFWLCKVIATNNAALLAAGSPALEVRIGNSSGNYHTIQIAGNNTYPVKGGWIILGVESETGTVLNWGVLTGSTINNRTRNWFGIRADFSATSKGENVAMDAIDLVTGLMLTGGGGADPDGRFQDYILFDEGDTANRYGCAIESDSDSILLNARNWIGRNENNSPQAAATIFTDSFFDVTFPEHYKEEDNVYPNGLGFDLGNASTVITLEDGNIKSSGVGVAEEFDTETDIDGTNNWIDIAGVNLQSLIPLGHPIHIGALYGTETPGVTNNTTYWVGHPTNGVASPSSTSAITLHTSRNNALLGTSPVSLTASSAGNGERWWIYNYSHFQGPDTRGSLLASPGAGQADITRCVISNLRLIQYVSGQTFADCTFVGVARFENEEAGTMCVFSGCKFISADTLHFRTTTFTTPTNNNPDYAFIADCPNPGNISDCEFTNKRAMGGHALHIVDGLSPLSFDMAGVLYNNFAAPLAGNDHTLHEFNATTDVNATTDEITLPAGHGYVTGDAVIYDSRETTATAIGGLFRTRSYYVNVKSPNNTMTLHLNRGDAINNNAPIALTASTTSPQEIHALYPANAAIWNDTGQAITINVTGGGDSPSVRNSRGSSTTINNNILITLTGLQPNTEVTVCLAGTETLVAEIEDTGSPNEFSFSVGSGTAIDIIIHHQQYEHIRLENQTFTAASTIPITQRFDRNYDNPVN